MEVKRRNFAISDPSTKRGCVGQLESGSARRMNSSSAYVKVRPVELGFQLGTVLHGTYRTTHSQLLGLSPSCMFKPCGYTNDQGIAAEKPMKRLRRAFSVNRDVRPLVHVNWNSRTAAFDNNSIEVRSVCIDHYKHTFDILHLDHH